MEFLIEHQLNIMLFLSGFCAALFVMVFFSRSIPLRRRLSLGAIELFAMLLLIFDILANIYRGGLGSVGFVMVRVSNFATFFLSLCIMKAFNQYVKSILSENEEHCDPSRLLTVVDILLYTGMALIVISQFTGIYYTFDDENRYQRGPLIMIQFALPLIALFIQLIEIMRRRKRLSKRMFVPLLLFIILPIIASLAQLFLYGLSLTNISIAAPSMTLYLFSLEDMNEKVKKAAEREIELLKEEHEAMQHMFEQTAMALASAIDAKDNYTHGHSRRVAEYSRRIAEKAGKSNEECDEIYYAALLHDVGKIGIPESIINKKGRLTDAEFETIKQHPVLGAKILEKIKDSPYLSIGAHYHHERYDGKGYPDHLKGEEIPEIARMISVADAYDAMTSLRSYRAPIPQQKVREEIVKCSGTQFDPEFAKIMLHLIDMDIEYKMIEWGEKNNERSGSELLIDSHRSEVSKSIHLINTLTVTSVTVKPFDRATGVLPRPSMILFDALDGQVHSSENEIKDMVYFEYGEIWFDGSTIVSGARKMQTNTIDEGSGKPDEYRIETARVKDHAIIRIVGEKQTNEVIIALPDSTRFAYIALTGEHCSLTDIRTEITETEVEIPRIAEEISYINEPAGDVPNVQVNGYRTAASEGIPVEDGMVLTFHAMSLPTARLVWHCPFLNVFGADDGKVYGDNYRDYMLVRLDGECWEGDPGCTVTAEHSRSDDFTGWDDWKDRSKAGFDCTFTFERKGNFITVRTENGGVVIRSTAEITDGNETIYAAVTGDQVAITNIRIIKQTI